MTLKEFQAERKLTLTALAQLLGRPVSTVHGWVNGTRRPEWESIDAIFRATGGAVAAGDFQDQRVGQRGFAETPPSLTPVPAMRDPAAAAEKTRREEGWERARCWAEENREAIEAHTRYVEENDTPLARYRMF